MRIINSNLATITRDYAGNVMRTEQNAFLIILKTFIGWMLCILPLTEIYWIKKFNGVDVVSTSMKVLKYF